MATPVADSFSAATGAVVFAGKSGTVAATSVGVVDYPNQRVYQRLGTSRSVPISGTCAGNPSILQWRVVDHTSGTGVTAWATLLTNPPASWNTDITIPQGGWYKVQVRCGVDNTKSATTSNKMGVGIVIGMFGQSNMVNRKDTSGGLRPLGDKRAVWYNSTNTAYERVGNINDNAPANTEASNSALYNTSPGVTVQTSVNGDGFVFTANLISQGVNAPVCQVFHALGGTTISQWQPGQSLWNAFVAKVAAVGGMEAAIYHQGESDATSNTKSSYKTSLANIHAGLKAVTGRTNSNFKFGIIILGTGPYSGSAPGKFGVIRAAQIEYATQTAGAYISSSAHDTATGADTVHIGGDFNKIARKDAKSFLWKVEGVGTNSDGPKVTSASRSGTTVTLTVTHAGGAALTDGAGGSGTALTGHQFFDSGAGGTMTASFATNVMTVTVAPPQALQVGMLITGGVSIPANTYISSFGTGTGGTGTYNLTTTPGTLSAQLVGAEIGVAATSIVGNTLVLTLASTPIGTLTYSYGMTDVPHGFGTTSNSFIPASCVYDNATYYNSTIGCPLQPMAAIAVT